MIALENMCGADKPDAELVADSLAGNRSAFNLIVARYQTLISALAYSATGSLTGSEDLAREIFVARGKNCRGTANRPSCDPGFAVSPGS